MWRGLTAIGHRLRALLRRGRWEAELDDEVRFHVEMETEKLVRRGVPRREAERVARLRFGGVERMKERAREERGTLVWDETVRDLRFAARSLLRSPGYTTVGVLTLALGIGANTAVFSVVDRVLLRPLPYPEADRLVVLREVQPDGERGWGSLENLRDYRDRASTFEALATFTFPRDETVIGLDEAIRVPAQGVSRGFFRATGVRPVRGRLIAPEENRVGGRPEIVVSERLWRRVATGPGSEVGELTLGIAGQDAVVVGVVPDGFQLLGEADLWYPLEQNPGLPNHRGSVGWPVVGRLAEGASLEQAREEMSAIAQAIGREYSDQTQITAMAVAPLRDEVVGDVRGTLWILLAASGLVLLVACTNLAATGLARGTARRRELAVRSSLGAGRGRLVRQLYTESFVLTAVGTVAGLGSAWVTLRAVAWLGAHTLPRPEVLGLDLRVTAYAALVAAGTSVLVGLLPALCTLGDPTPRALRAGDRGGSANHRGGPWSLLIAGEVALAVVLLVGASLLLRTLWQITRVDPGFRTEGVVTADIRFPQTLYPNGALAGDFVTRAIDELRAHPGLTHAGAVNLLPTYPGSISSQGIADIEGGVTPDDPTVNYRTVAGDYFETLEIPLIRGRLPDARDGPGAPHVAVINETMAERFWPGRDPVGRRMFLGGMDPYRDDWITVVGIVGEARRWDLDEGTQAEYYIPQAQRPLFGWLYGMTLTVRGRSSVGDLSHLVRTTLRTLDPQVPVEVETLERRVAETWTDRRFVTVLLVAFAVIGLALAAVGIYGVVSYTVARRRREAGIRVALGAIPGQVARMIRRETLAVVAAGLALGAAVALVLSRTLERLLFGVTPLDPAAYVAAAAGLLVVAWIAAAVPAHRATRVDPVAAMRGE